MNLMSACFVNGSCRKQLAPVKTIEDNKRLQHTVRSQLLAKVDVFEPSLSRLVIVHYIPKSHLRYDLVRCWFVQ